MGLEAGLGEALRTDYFMLREEFTPAQLDYLERAGRNITGVSAFTAGA